MEKLKIALLILVIVSIFLVIACFGAGVICWIWDYQETKEICFKLMGSSFFVFLCLGLIFGLIEEFD